MAANYTDTLDKLEHGVVSTLELIADLLSQLAEIRSSSDAEQQRLIAKCTQVLENLKSIQSNAALLAPLEQQVAFHKGQAYVERRVVQLVKEEGPAVLAKLQQDTQQQVDTLR